jgi:hypothetical protein
MPATKYWAATETEDCVNEAWTRMDKFYSVLRASRLLDLYRNAYWNRYVGARSGGNIGISGEVGELTNVELGTYGSLIHHMMTLILGQRPAFDAKAANADFDSMAQAIMANSLLESVMRDRGLEGCSKTTVDYGLTFGMGRMAILWDAFEGPVFRPPLPGDERGGSVDEKSGDIRFVPLTPMDVVIDTLKEGSHDHSYKMIRTWQNKYDLMAKYPELEDEIDRLPTKYSSESVHPRIWSYQYSQTTGIYETEDVEVWTLFHRPSDAIPDGRMMSFASPDVVLSDGALPYRRIPVFDFSPIEMLGTPWGYTPFHDCLSLQYALNSIISTIVTNQAALGVQNVWVPAGSNLSWKEIVGGLNLVEGGTQPPQALNLLQTKEETFKLFELINKLMELFSGINPVVRGDPAASLKSGSALALVQAQAVQFSSIIQQSYVNFMEKTATEVLHQYQDHADLPHIMTITGIGNRQYTKSFTKKDIAKVDRVTINIGNPLSATVAGRYNIAELMAQMKLVQNPAQLDMVLTTGRLEPVTKNPRDEMMNIEAENERLLNGKPVIAALFDNHPLHIQENSSVLNSPEAREKPDVVQNATQHILEHMNLWQRAAQEAPAVLAAKQIPPPPQPPPPPAPPGMPPGMPPGPPQMAPGAAQPLPPPPSPGQPEGPPRGGAMPLPPRVGPNGARAPLPANATPPIDLE